jgi:chorismate mutase
VTSPETDPAIRRLREQITDNDRILVETINKRLQLVGRLKGYKHSRGIAFVDPEREQKLLEHLAQANGGPLTEEGLRELLASVLDLTKREVERGSSP